MKNNKYIFFILAIILLAVKSFGQPANDDCETAIVLESVDEWCSEDNAFSNIDATPGKYGAPGCWDATGHDVWFRFTATASSATIVVYGKDKGGTLIQPMIALYKDNGCYGTLEQLKCKKDFDKQNIVEMNQAGLITGESYLIRISGEFGSTGTFKLCINNFYPPVEPGQDCKTAALLCDKSPFVVKYVTGAGDDPHETDETCIKEERQTTWFKWIAKNDGTLTFTLTPLQDIDDLDFVVFELPNGYDDCSEKIVLRCNATYGGNHVSCGPLTGLSLDATELEEDLNCDAGEDGFVRYLDMEKGHAYALVVNNWSSSGIGFSIKFGGTGEFEGPEPDFAFDPPSGLRCEDSISIINLTEYKLGKIVDYFWTFGRDAIPQLSHDSMPHKVFYDSYGWKSVTLTVKSDKGCTSTLRKDIWMEPCCEDLPEDERIKLVVDTLKSPSCEGYDDAFVEVSGIRGDPYYRYSIGDTNFTYNHKFLNLSAGEYKIYIVDKKGCKDSTIVNIEDPEPLVVDAGPDQTIDLGDYTFMNGSYRPQEYDVVAKWTPAYNLEDTLDLKTKAFPYFTTTYTLTVTQVPEGCTAKDSMTIFVKDNRKVSIPNVFTPNGDGYNDMFTAYNVKAGLGIEEMFIYDRWGELVFYTNDIPLGDATKGWDGTFKGQKVSPGVYVYLIRVKYLGDKIIDYAGDITVLR